jgi:AcrR family transcriptional regulator
MKIQRQDAIRTRKNLLRAAGEVFADKGYRDATIAEISERAGTNIAAVNYHFGDKETLYREAWRQSFHDSIKAHQPGGGVGDDEPLEERLRGRVVALLRRITDKDNREFRIVQKELANPTGLLEEVMTEEFAPLRRKLEDLVREFLGPESSQQQVRFCATSIMSQCVIPVFLSSAKKPESGGENGSWKIEDVDRYAEHVVTFSLAAMHGIKNK